MPDIAFVNGRFLPLADAVVSIEDRGFQFGDGIYEVIRTYGGRPFELPAHLQRLDRSARALEMLQPYPHDRWTQLIEEGIRRAGYEEARIYVQITRGAAPREHTYSADLVPTTVMIIREFHPLSDTLKATGVAVITTDDIRWGRCDIKSINLLGNVLARQQGKNAGAFETIFLRDGRVIEGATSNVMVVREGSVMTAPEGTRILSGVTRNVVLELARTHGIAVHEQYPSQADLHEAEEVLLTGTTVEIMPVVTVNGKAIGTGKPGRITKQLAEWFRLRTG